VSLLWAVPVVAVAVAAGLVLARTRALEQASLELLVAVRRTADLRPPLVDVRDELARTGPLVDRLWSHWDPDDLADDVVSGPDESR
jgi:hypothetical protein